MITGAAPVSIDIGVYKGSQFLSESILNQENTFTQSSMQTGLHYFFPFFDLQNSYWGEFVGYLNTCIFKEAASKKKSDNYFMLVHLISHIYD